MRGTFQSDVVFFANDEIGEAYLADAAGTFCTGFAVSVRTNTTASKQIEKFWLSKQFTCLYVHDGSSIALRTNLNRSYRVFAFIGCYAEAHF